MQVMNQVWYLCVLCVLLGARRIAMDPSASPISKKLMILDIDSTFYNESPTEDGTDLSYVRNYLQEFCTALHSYYDMVLYTSASMIHAEFVEELLWETFDCNFQKMYARDDPSMLYVNARLSELDPWKSITIKNVKSLLPQINADLRKAYTIDDVVYIDDGCQHFHRDCTSAMRPIWYHSSPTQGHLDAIESNRRVGIQIYPMDVTYDAANDVDLLLLIQPLRAIVIGQCATTKLFEGLPLEKLSLARSFESCPPMKAIMDKRQKDKYLLALDMDKTVYLKLVRDGHPMHIIRSHLESFIHSVLPFYDIVLYSAGVPSHVQSASQKLEDFLGMSFRHVINKSHVSFMHAMCTWVDGSEAKVPVKSVPHLLESLNKDYNEKYTMEHTVFLDDNYIHFLDETPFPLKRKYTFATAEDWNAVQKHHSGNKAVALRILPLDKELVQSSEYAKDPETADRELFLASLPLQRLALTQVKTTLILNGDTIEGTRWDILDQIYALAKDTITERYLKLE